MSDEIQLTSEVVQVTRIIETVTLDAHNESMFAEIRAMRNRLEALVAQSKLRSHEKRDYDVEHNLTYAVSSLGTALGKLIR